MKIDIITLFPSMFTGFLSESIIGRAIKENKVEINLGRDSIGIDLDFFAFDFIFYHGRL